MIKTNTSLNPEPQDNVLVTKAFFRAADLLEISQKDLAQILGASEPTVSRWARHLLDIDTASKQGEIALLFLRLFRSLDPLVGSDAQKRHDWLRSHNKALNGTPAALIETPTGLVNALAYLDGMRAAA